MHMGVASDLVQADEPGEAAVFRRLDLAVGLAQVQVPDRRSPAAQRPSWLDPSYGRRFAELRQQPCHQSIRVVQQQARVPGLDAGDSLEDAFLGSRREPLETAQLSLLCGGP